VLAPVDLTSVTRSRAHRCRRLVVDGVTIIPSEMMKRNIGYVDDIVRHSVDMAPPTKRLMMSKEFSSVEKLLTMPGKNLASYSLLKVRVSLIVATVKFSVFA